MTAFLLRTREDNSCLPPPFFFFLALSLENTKKTNVLSMFQSFLHSEGQPIVPMNFFVHFHDYVCLCEEFNIQEKANCVYPGLVFFDHQAMLALFSSSALVFLSNKSVYHPSKLHAVAAYANPSF